MFENLPTSFNLKAIILDSYYINVGKIKCETHKSRIRTCIWTRNSVFIRLVDSDSLSLRDPHNESTSSMKIILGFCSLAIANSDLTNFSDSPSHLLTKSELETDKNVELFASVATALAKYDLPVPGG